MAVVSCISLFFLQTRQIRGARPHTRPRNRKPGAVSRPGGWRTFGEYAFLEDSRYTSQEDYEGRFDVAEFLAFPMG
jgi:hypothetical protein